jgi:signal transduction histidine kinase
MLTNAKDDKQKHLLQIICKEVDRLTDIVTDFLSFTRLRSIELTTFDLNNLIMDVVVLLHHSKQFPDNMKLLFNELPDPFYIMADEKQLKQAFLNIGLNALEAMPNGGKLEITLTPNEIHDSIEIQISDSGSGIPKESLNNIFDSFFTTKNSGSGIGLYVTQKIIHSHRGKISVKSSQETGTTFHIILPTNIKHNNEQL